MNRAIDAWIRFCLDNRLVVLIIAICVIGWGLVVMPFDFVGDSLPRDPVPVDALPDVGENQQIVFTAWPGHSPQDVEDQITYPLTVSLLGVPGVRTIRSLSMLGFSSVYVVFEEDVEFYWSRSRILERLNVARRDLPQGVTPLLGPDATGLGQVFWYTLEGRDVATGEPTGGWDLDELRSIQDWQVRYALQSTDGVAEVAGVGGFTREYQIDVDPDAMRAHGVTLHDVYRAVGESNRDVGARTIEINRVEYVLRGLGLIQSLDDLEQTVIGAREGVPVRLSEVATVSAGPALRRGALDKQGAEAVGGVVVVRYGENPLEVISRVKEKIEQIAPGLPTKTLDDGSTSRVAIVPFYDRTQLINETLGTLRTALLQQILVTVIVVVVMVWHLRSSLLISGLLPMAVIMAFIAMKQFGVDSNIMSLSGIAIAIGTMVDMGVILCENILRHLEETEGEADRDVKEIVFAASTEVGRPVLTAILTTVISFLPVFVMTGPEGKLFGPLAYTKTFALIASVVVALSLIPPAAHLLFTMNVRRRVLRIAASVGLIAAGVIALVASLPWVALLLVGWGIVLALQPRIPRRFLAWPARLAGALLVLGVTVILSRDWMPLGVEPGLWRNFLFLAMLIGGLLGVFLAFMHFYEPLLRFFLAHKMVFYTMPAACVVGGMAVWLGFGTIFGWLPATLDRVGLSGDTVRHHPAWVGATHKLPGLGKQFMPDLDEGSYLLMPVTMPHGSIGEALDVLATQDQAIGALPEVDQVVGKIGRVDSPLDPAPVSMIETIITYHAEYLLDPNGLRERFAHDASQVDLFRDVQGTPLPAPDGKPYRVSGKFLRDDQGRLVPDDRGVAFRRWRPAVDTTLNPDRDPWPGIRSPTDIWDVIEQASRLVGTTRASSLQPIAARIVMLQSGIRGSMAVLIRGDRLEDIERVALAIEKLLKQVPGVNPDNVNADRIVGKPYLEIDIDREAIARHGLSVTSVQHVIETAIGGRRITTTLEGRQRYGVRIRYPRELRNTIDRLGDVLVPAPAGERVPLRQLAEIRYVRGPQVIKSEDGRLIGYVTFGKLDGYGEVDVVEAAQRYLFERIDSGQLVLPAGTERPEFVGTYQNQIRSARTLSMVVPLALGLIFIILYLQFRSVTTAMLVFCGVFVAISGGFMLLGLYGSDWFLDFDLLGRSMREVFQVNPILLSVAVWVGFIALVGIATDDGVVVASYLDMSFAQRKPKTIAELREATVQAGVRRIRPCLMTTATTILALLPVLTSTGRGSDVMVPMAIPSFGGMLIELITLFFVPVSYCWIRECSWTRKSSEAVGRQQGVQ